MPAPTTAPNGPPGPATRHDAVRLLDADPDLGVGLTSARRAEAELLVVGTQQLCVGAWQVAGMPALSSVHLGPLVLHGVISREVVVADAVNVELLRPGDLIRPWPVGYRTRLLGVDVQWWCSRPPVSRCSTGTWPSNWRHGRRSSPACSTASPSDPSTCHIAGDLAADGRRPAPAGAVLEPGRARVGTAGIMIPLALTHRILGHLVGAARPTISSALGGFAKRDQLVRGPHGSWLPRGKPPTPARPHV
jgi:CRP/FNR family cyclic AMP-dependent transcriptional regulator